MPQTHPQETFHTEIPQNQINAMVYSVQVGLELQQEFPWIEKLFRSGMPATKIAEEPGIRERVPGSKRTIENVISYALKGYTGNVRLSEVQPYEGFIPLDEYNELVSLIRAQNAARVSREMKEQGRGLFAMTLERKQEIGKKSGLNGYEKGLGIHAQTYEERRVNSRLAVLKKGGTPWTDAEMALNYKLSQDSRYHINDKLNIKKLASAVNDEFHKGKLVRNNRSIPKAIKRWQAHLERIGN